HRQESRCRAGDEAGRRCCRRAGLRRAGLRRSGPEPRGVVEPVAEPVQPGRRRGVVGRRAAEGARGRRGNTTQRRRADARQGPGSAAHRGRGLGRREAGRGGARSEGPRRHSQGLRIPGNRRADRQALAMQAFRHGRSAHPNWRTATELLIAQLDDGRATSQAALGLLYVTERLAERIAAVATLLRERFPAVQWIGASAHGVCASGAEFTDDAAMTAVLCDRPPDSWRVVRGQSGWPPADRPGTGERRATPAAFTALVHAEPTVCDLAESVATLAARTDTGFLFGGLVGGSQPNSAQLADGVVRGGISGATFDDRVRLLSRVTQGCTPLARAHVISGGSSRDIQRRDGHPALDVLLEDLGVAAEVRASRDGDEILRALPAERLSNGLMVGLAPAARDRGIGFSDY